MPPARRRPARRSARGRARAVVVPPSAHYRGWAPADNPRTKRRGECPGARGVPAPRLRLAVTRPSVTAWLGGGLRVKTLGIVHGLSSSGRPSRCGPATAAFLPSGARWARSFRLVGSRPGLVAGPRCSPASRFSGARPRCDPKNVAARAPRSRSRVEERGRVAESRRSRRGRLLRFAPASSLLRSAAGCRTSSSTSSFLGSSASSLR
jgi:hypothetical protein